MSEIKPAAGQHESTRPELFHHRLIRINDSLLRLFLSDADSEAHRLTCELPDPGLPANAESIERAAGQLVELAIDMARHWQIGLQGLYAERLAELATRNPAKMAEAGVWLGADFALAATNWPEIQAAQALHDRYFHRDVVKWSPGERLRHYFWHLGKLPHKLQAAVDAEDYVARRRAVLPDIFAFGILLANLADYDLAASELPFDAVSAGRPADKSRVCLFFRP